MTLPAPWSTCALCPRLCRTACPVATGGALETAVPSFIATVLAEWVQGRVPDADARHVATLCVDCGACQRRCHIDRPLPALLRDARARLLDPPRIEPLQEIAGDGAWIAVEADDRPLARALSKVLDEPVARWPTGDRLGVAAVEHGMWAARAAQIRERVGHRRVVVVDGGVARALRAAGVGFQWLHEVERSLWPGAGSCEAGGDRPLACCGAAEPLASHHPEVAARIGALWMDRADDYKVADGRCRAHLRACGAEAADPLDALLERLGEGGG